MQLTIQWYLITAMFNWSHLRTASVSFWHAGGPCTLIDFTADVRDRLNVAEISLITLAASLVQPLKLR